MSNYSSDYEAWWAVMRDWFRFCDRRISGKPQAYKLWQKMKLSPAESDRIKQATQEQAAHHIRVVSAGGFDPAPQDPVRYLRNQRWLDEVGEDKATPAAEPGRDKAGLDKATPEDPGAIVQEAIRIAKETGIISVGGYLYESTIRVAARDLMRAGVELTPDGINKRAQDRARALSRGKVPRGV